MEFNLVQNLLSLLGFLILVFTIGYPLWHKVYKKQMNHEVWSTCKGLGLIYFVYISMTIFISVILWKYNQDKVIYAGELNLFIIYTARALFMMLGGLVGGLGSLAGITLGFCLGIVYLYHYIKSKGRVSEYRQEQIEQKDFEEKVVKLRHQWIKEHKEEMDKWIESNIGE